MKLGVEFFGNIVTERNDESFEQASFLEIEALSRCLTCVRDISATASIKVFIFVLCRKKMETNILKWLEKRGFVHMYRPPAIVFLRDINELISTAGSLEISHMISSDVRILGMMNHAGMKLRLLLNNEPHNARRNPSFLLRSSPVEDWLEVVIKLQEQCGFRHGLCKIK